MKHVKGQGRRGGKKEEERLIFSIWHFDGDDGSVTELSSSSSSF